MTNYYAHKVGFTYEYFVLDKIKDDFDNVWHWKDFPEKLMYECNLIKDYDIFCKYRYDIGADLVAFKDNKYYFIQCKNYNDTILMENLAGFYFLLYEYNLTGILYYNGKLSQRVLDLSTNKIKFINMPFNNSTIDIIQDIEKPLIVRDYQLEAYNKLLYKSESILSLPCGMGKTYTTYLMAKHYNNIIILSPLRYLAFQTLEQYKKYLGSEYSPILISLDGKRKLEDINNYIQDKNIISSTYDSVDILIQIIDKLQTQSAQKNIYLIIDEFHNLSDNNINDINNDMYKILNYNCDKIFVSATPLKDFMNINEIYNYNWKDAITNKYICDFTIYIPDKNEDYQLFVELLRKTCNNNLNDKIIKKAYFILKSLLFNGDRKCISYMTKIEYATDMCNILNWMSKLLGVEIEYWQIDCNTKKTIRENIINNFIKSIKIAILINVHILDEGINIKECDSVFITQPSKNIINIIQRMCRANRICENKSNCNIYLWCKEKKTDEILNYINNNTQEFIKNKVFIYNTENKIIEKYIIKNSEKFINTNNIESNNILLKDNLIEFIKNNNLLIDINFLTDFFNIGGNSYGDTYKNINFDDIVKWLDVQKNHLKRLLKNNFKIIDDYTEEKILIKNKNRGANYVYKIMLTPDCFKELCMLSQSDKAKGIRKYYITAEGLLRDHFEQIINDLNKELGLIKTNIKKQVEVIGGHIYILKAMNTTQQNMFKLGNSDDMKKRLRVYNTGNANNIEPLFVMKVDDINMVEGCIKNLAKEFQYKKNKEVYNIDFEFLKKLCIKCKNFIKQLEKEFVNDTIKTKTKLKMIKNNRINKNTSYYMIIDKK